MKTIKIFLASSEELAPERENFTDLVLRINKLFKGRGLELDLEKWEYFDSSVSVNPEKQDDYDEILKECEMCLAIFWRRFGRFSEKEFNIARQQFIEGKNPRKIYVFFKNLDKEDVITDELKTFKENVYNHYGHFYCKFANVDTLKLEFLLQLELYQKGLLGEKAIEVRQEHVYVDNEAVADLNNIPFASNNDGFKKMQAELKELKIEITDLQAELEKKQQKLERKKAKIGKVPDDEDYREEFEETKEEVDALVDKLQKKLNRKNELEKEFDREQQSLFNTARRITELRGQKISGRMARAIDAFEDGDAQRADAILDEAERDADEALADIRTAKQLGLQSLEELILKASVKMANDTIPIEERVSETRSIYEKADNLAQEVSFGKKKYAKLLRNYGLFLEKRDRIKALEVFGRQVKLLEEIYGPNSIYLARAYDDMARIWKENTSEHDLTEAWMLLEKALEIQNMHLGNMHADVAKTYCLMGEVQIKRLQYEEAEVCIGKAIDICENTVGKMNLNTALAYRAMGMLQKLLYNDNKDKTLYEEAVKNNLLAIEILETIVGTEHDETLNAYNNLANLFRVAGEYDNALDLHKKSLAIKEGILGFYHFSTALEYNNLGIVYHDLAAYNEALDCFFISLEIKKNLFKEENYSFSLSYKRIGVTYYAMGNKKEAQKYLLKALDIRKRVLKEDDPRIEQIQEELDKCNNNAMF